MRDLSSTEMGSVFNLIWKDIDAKKRRGKSVVTVSLNSRTAIDPNDPDLSTPRKSERDDIANLLANDVIVVVSAGNHATDKNNVPTQRQNVDTIPAAHERPNYPLIVVGAVDYTGAKAAFSQGGPHVTILGPGVDITCQDKVLKRPWTDSGTSFCKFAFIIP